MSVAPDLPVGARLHQFREKWVALGASPEVVTTQRGLHPPLPVPAKFDQVTHSRKLMCKSPQEPLPGGGLASASDQKCSGISNNSKVTRVLQQAIFGTRTQQPVETYLGPNYLEQLSKHRVVQNGDTRDNKTLPTGRGLGYFRTHTSIY